MDTSTAIFLIIALFAVIVVAIAVRSKWIRVNIRTPLGAHLDVEASSEASPPPPAVTVEDVESTAGGVLADDHTGRGAKVKGAKAKDDILASSTPPPRDSDPKAEPPA